MPSPLLSYRAAALQTGLAALLIASTNSHVHAIDTRGVAEFRSADGSGNHLSDTDRGQTGSLLIRIAPAEYGDGQDLPRGVPIEDEGNGDVEADEQTLPSGRQISNSVHDQGSANIPSRRRLNQFFFQFGQFLSHDTGLSEPDASVATGGATGLSGNESFDVPIPVTDPDFAFDRIRATRTVSVAATETDSGIREQINTITAFIDASNVYGSTQARANALRTFQGGRLKVSSGPGGDLLPRNTFGLENANPLHLPETSLFAAGDVRANEQVGLIAFHTLFLREHNRLAAEIASADFRGSNLASPAIDEAIYQRARAGVAAILQKITYYEWLPALLGFDAIPAYRGYLPWVDPQVSNEFSTAAFRLGHTMLPPVYQLEAKNGTVVPLALQNAFFNPEAIANRGIDTILRGQAGNRQQEIDRFLVDDVRNFLFGPGFGGLDLAALNIQRGRDHGIPSFHILRTAYGLPGLNGFGDLSRNGSTAAALAAAYGNGNFRDIDAWTGGVSEDHLPGTNLGPTFTRVFIDQFVRLRDGDRFYFENRDVYSPAFIRSVLETSLADVVQRNTGLSSDDVNPFAFFVPEFHPFQPDLTIGLTAARRTHRGNNRYNAIPRFQRAIVSSTSGRSARFRATLQNDGAFRSTNAMRASLRSAHFFSARIFEFVPGRRINQTGSLFTGRYRRVSLPGTERRYQGVVRVFQREGVAARNTTLQLRARSTHDRSARDSVEAIVGI